uniref:ORFA n=1 Tax=Isosicyonis striata TaxID=478986 RepID=A0A0U2E1R4_9CNID|nr:ORFA [Isosicyonis striata]
MSQLALKNLIKRKWLSVIIISYLFFIVVKSGGDNFICVKATLLSLAILLAHFWLSWNRSFNL